MFRNLAHGELTIGVGPLIAESIVGPVVGRLVARHPQLHISVQLDDFAQFPERLRHRELDLFIADITAIQAEADFKIVAVPTQEWVWFCRAGHPLAGRRSVSLAEFFSYPIVLPKLASWMITWFAMHGPTAAPAKGRARPFRPAMTCSHFSALKTVVEGSDAICGAISSALTNDFRAGRFVQLPVEAPKMSLTAGIVTLKGRTLSPSALALAAEMQNQLAVQFAPTTMSDERRPHARYAPTLPHQRRNATELKSNGTSPKKLTASNERLAGRQCENAISAIYPEKCG